MEAEWELVDEGPFKIMRLGGRWELMHHFELHEIFEQLLQEEPPKIILNLAAVDHISSSIVGAFVRLSRDARQKGGWVSLVALSQSVRFSLQMLQLDDLFLIHRSEQEAMQQTSN
ncbi:MAG: STAS domain-containing protein [Leptospiraceae bacterium]|nr:STAS domain-containing protein [Leptospiraceae bacterium]MCB1305296.1 STAS domain-containing protein [Leptospiraceae bacterium]